MTKKNLKPQQAAPVQREINTTSSEGGTGLTPLHPNTYLKKCQKSFSACQGARFAPTN
ncbi:MAG: anacyclamide/piricyclamide family prenylated cyclic peptide [Microcystis aeruginosa G13-05]|nr:anacyclamide/piricyclamide family prenylated cyclic peptide [Microcystis aeruginosa G13-05]